MEGSGGFGSFTNKTIDGSCGFYEEITLTMNTEGFHDGIIVDGSWNDPQLVCKQEDYQRNQR